MPIKIVLHLSDGSPIHVTRANRQSADRIDTLWYQRLDFLRQNEKDLVRAAADAGSLAAWWRMTGRYRYRPGFIGQSACTLTEAFA